MISFGQKIKVRMCFINMSINYEFIQTSIFSFFFEANTYNVAQTKAFLMKQKPSYP